MRRLPRNWGSYDLGALEAPGVGRTWAELEAPGVGLTQSEARGTLYGVPRTGLEALGTLHFAPGTRGSIQKTLFEVLRKTLGSQFYATQF